MRRHHLFQGRTEEQIKNNYSIVFWTYGMGVLFLLSIIVYNFIF